MTAKEFTKLKIELDELPILYKIDIVHFEKSNDALKVNILKDGKLFFIKKVKLQDIGKVFSGSSAPQKEEYFLNGKYPFVRTKDLATLRRTNNLKVTNDYVNDLCISKSNLVEAKIGTVLFPKSGASIGNNNRAMLGVDAYIVSHLGAFYSNNQVINQYVYYYFLKLNLLNYCENESYPSLKISVVKDLLIPFPSLTKQKQIAKILDKAGELIALRKESIKKLDALSKSIFIDMFGDPIANPKGWKNRKLGSIFKVKHGFAFKSEFFSTNGDYILLTPGNFLEEGGFKYRGDKQKYYIGEFPSEYILDKETLLLAMTEQASGLLGSALIVPKNNIFLHNQRLGLVSPKEIIQVFYLFHLFNQKSIRKIIHFKATGIKVRHTSPTKIEDIIIGYPPIELQNNFANKIEKIEHQKALYEEQLQKLQANFDALLAQSFKA